MYGVFEMVWRCNGNWAWEMGKMDGRGCLVGYVAVGKYWFFQG